MKYTEVEFSLTPFNEAFADALMAELGNIGYDSFSYADNGFCGYIDSTKYDGQAIRDMEVFQYFSQLCQIEMKVKEIEDQDWNKTWEDSFTPIIVDNRVQVRASFHTPAPGIEYDIIIEPKMSFGTGHHSTTALMLKTIMEHKEEIRGRRLLDMGCGTGILSIMAAKVGAREIVGIDIDEWAYNNAMENMANNHIDNIHVKIGDASLLKAESSFDVILANINRNILLRDMNCYVERLNPQGLLIMSGFYEKDLPMIREKAAELGLTYLSYHEDKEWVAACFCK